MTGESDNPVVIALVGNPNCGKTVLFNALTGSRQKVGNWSGVTVDKKTGQYVFEEKPYRVVDLPGAYSTSVASKKGSVDERIACQYLLSHEADVIVNVIDGNNLERNLYLSLQLIEMRIPTILVVNMMDIVEKRGMCLDLTQLGKRLNCPVISLVASQKKGIEDLKIAVTAMCKRPKCSDFVLPLTNNMQASVHRLKEAIQSTDADSTDPQWLAQRLLEGDVFAVDQVSPEVRAMLRDESQQLEMSEGEEPDILIADARYGLVSDIALAVTQIIKAKQTTITQRIDRILLNRFLGIPIFLLMMYFMFVFSIGFGGAFQDFFEFTGITIFIKGSAYLLTQWHAPVWVTAFVANGVGRGITTVLTFIPVLGAMFLFLAFLEASGYMSRAAFVMDRFMQKLGLPGKSFVPMIVGFGCNVPAVMGTRILASQRDRILTVLMVPFMSCGARLAIFAVFAGAFFPAGGGNIIFLLYVTGIIAAILTGLLLRKTVLHGSSAPLVMELPPYHVPRFGALSRHMWQRLSVFIIRAAKIIIPVCVIIGVLNSVTMKGELVHGQLGSQQSLLAELGRVVTPALAPMGIQENNWPATVGLVTGVLAKEVVVGTLNTLYSRQVQVSQKKAQHFSLWAGLRSALLSIPNNLFGKKVELGMHHAVYGVMYQRFDGKIGAFAYLLFILLYFPCISTMAAIRRELNRRWAAFSVVWSVTFAYVAAVIVYQALTFIRHPLNSIAWISLMLAYLIITVFVLRYEGVLEVAAE